MIIEYNTEKRYRLIEAISLKFAVYRWLVIKFPDLRRIERETWRPDTARIVYIHGGRLPPTKPTNKV
mgnify:CR=1 FL=1